ncbi:unnamed protein product [Cylicocyclus nassatus]|uniref:Nudix hydrolase domain-containing protein n=1 Tax=Cylicocyclus nassatus TaxID=53992 RepID=A0AA36LZM7_CYLNA|nr:unnamed protein product [Cylicocyclus nassatus]
MLPAKTTVNRDILVHTSTLPKKVKTNFKQMLSNSLKSWKELGIEVAHIGINLKDAFLVPLLARRGFKFSFVTDDGLTMSRWVPDTASPLVPRGSYHHCVQCLVVDKLGRILVIKEQKHTDSAWKLPGGKAQNCEKIFDTAKRKVLEQTGIRATPDAIISVKHRAALPHSIYIGTFFFSCLMHTEEDADKQDASHHSHEYVASWFTRDELRSFDIKDFFEQHRNIFLQYDEWLKSSTGQDTAFTKDGWRFHHCSFFSEV